MTSTPPEASSGPTPEGPGRGAEHGPGHGTPGGAEPEGPRATRDELRDLGRLRRSVTDRKVAGVAGGLARHLDIDPVILRVAFVVLAFFGGAGLILYGACWLLLPEEGNDSAPLGLDERNRSIALIVVGVFAGLALLGDTLGTFHFPWPLAILALVVLMFLHRRDRSARPPTPIGSPSPYGPQPYPGTYAASYPTAGPTTGPTAGSTTDPAAGSATDPASGSATDPATDPGAGPEPSWAPTAYAPPGYDPALYDYGPQYHPVRVRSPRKRGPILFWFTLALIALAEGVLGIVDMAGADVADTAYPALAVAVTGAMLLIGAFFGRAGGLILVGLVSTAVLAATMVAGEVETTTVRETPVSAVRVQDSYDISSGELVLDLRIVSDLDRLDGRSIRVSADAGAIEVIVPDGLDTRVNADVDGPGNIELFGEETGGFDIAMSREHDGGTDVPSITIDADLSVGQIQVHE
jgi:phage shock protein PspC (stress-responsive transcriptional regulator)